MNRLRLHDVVRITVPQDSRGGFRAVVLAFSERGMTLECLDKDCILRLRDVTPDAFVTFRHESTLVALPGTLYCLKPAGDLRFQVAEKSLYRSRGTRMKVEMPIAVRHMDTGAQAEGTTVNIGPDGILIECELEVEVGDPLAVSFASPQTDEQVTGIADVVRAGDGLVAVHLRPESADARNALGQAVVALSRAELSRAAQHTDVGPGF